MKCLLTSNVVKEKKFRIVGAVILSVIVITVIIICSTLFRSGDDRSNSVDENSTEVPSPFTKALIVQIGNSDLWALDLDNNNSTFLIKNWKDRIHSFDYYLKKTAYIGSSEIGVPIKSSSGQYPELLQPTDWVADKIAVDYVNHKVYVLDVLASNINIFDLRENHYNIVLSHYRGSKDIALDSVSRLMFILQSTSIVRANIDGSSQKTVVDTTALSSFAIDYEDKVYYADLENINSVSYTGHEHRIITKISNEVISIAALENNLFWLYKSYDSENSILYSCKIANGSCPSFSKLKLSGTTMQIKAYKFDKNQIFNPCAVHDCNHICIMNSTNSSRCACSIDWQLSVDLKSCKHADDFLLYIEGNYVKSLILGDLQESFIEAILPLKLNTSLSKECNFDVDVRNRILVFSDERNMYQMDLRTDGKQIEVTSNETPSIIILAIDWISNNLYYTSTEIFENEGLKWYKTHIKVHNMLSVESFENNRIIHSEYERNITSLVVHANKGVLFYTILEMFDFSEVNLGKIHLDGSLKSVYEQELSISRDKNVLGIDCEDDRLYWFNEVKDKIHFTDLDGEIKVKNISIKFIEYSVTMSIYKSWLYICTSKSVWRLDKVTGEGAIQILPQFHQETNTIFGAKVFNQAIQRIDKNHPCAINNGDCQRYCFAIPSLEKTLQKVCGCNENENLNHDGKTCSQKEIKGIDYSMTYIHDN